MVVDVIEVKDGTGLVTWSVMPVGWDPCVTEDTAMAVRFRDGTTIELGNDMGSNCVPVLSANLADPYESAETRRLLAEKELQSIRVVSPDGFVEADLEPEQSEVLRAVFECTLQ